MNTFVTYCFLMFIIEDAYLQKSTQSIFNSTVESPPYIKPIGDLEKNLLRSYDRTLRPVKNSSTVITVEMYMSLKHIEEVNEEEQIIKLHGRYCLEWKDEFLVWDENEYNGLDVLVLNSESIWKLNLMIFNSADANKIHLTKLKYLETYLAKVFSDGTVWICERFIIKFTCLFDYSNFPYDIQECPLIISPTTLTIDSLELIRPEHQPIFTSFVSFNDTKTILSNWDVLKVWSEIKYWNALEWISYDKKPPKQVSGYTFTEYFIWLRIKRSVPYFGATILLPSVMTSFFTVASIWIKSSTNGIMILMANLMVQAIFMNDLIQKLPPNNGAVPKIVYYFSINVTLNVVAIIVLTFIISLSKFSLGRRIPSALRTIVDRYWFVLSKVERKEDYVPKIAIQKNFQETLNGSVVSWVDVAGVFKLLFFILFSMVYLFCMFEFLL